MDQLFARRLLWNESDIDVILERAAATNAGVLIIDSMQTVACPDVAGSPGAMTQLRESAARCLRAAKTLGLPVILIGHVTKQGEIAVRGVCWCCFARVTPDVGSRC